LLALASQAFVVLRLADEAQPSPHRLSEWLGQRGARYIFEYSVWVVLFLKLLNLYIIISR
jgi:hypothetical protein